MKSARQASFSGRAAPYSSSVAALMTWPAVLSLVAGAAMGAVGYPSGRQPGRGRRTTAVQNEALARFRTPEGADVRASQGSAALSI